MVLPSVEHFQKRYKYPRVYFLFYEYFVRAVVGEKKWNKSMSDKNARLCTCIAEAYTHSLIENNYFAWLFEYKHGTKNCELKTEYEESTVDGDKNGWEDRIYMPRELRDVEIEVPKDNKDAYKIITALTDKEWYETLREERRKNQLSIGKAARNEKTKAGHKRDFKSMEKKLQDIGPQVEGTDPKETTKKKRKIMKELKIFKGSTNTMKKFISDTTNEINEDRKSGIKRMFEEAFREMIFTIDFARHGVQEEEESQDNKGTDINCDQLYGVESEDDGA